MGVLVCVSFLVGVEAMARRDETLSMRARLLLARPMLLRAGLLGLCIGLVVIGLMENVTRFGSPETLRSDARVSPTDPRELSDSQPLREDRLDVAIRIDDANFITLR
jgi:hypothetical protein